MKKIIPLCLILFLSLSLYSCKDNSNQTESLSNLVVGSWRWTSGEGPENGVMDMELYAGGTGKGTNNLMTNGEYYPITWTISGDIINITASDLPASGFKYENNSLVSVDSGKTTYTLVE